MDFTLTYPSRITFGAGAIDRLPAEVLPFGSLATVVTGRSGLRGSGALDHVLELLNEAGIESHVFDAVEPDPSLATVENGVALAKQTGASAVIGLGGGSALDAAKAIAIAATQPESVRLYHAGTEITRDGLPFIAVPTTAGTGAEITRNAVLTDEGTRQKLSLRSPRMVAKAAILDPELTTSLPPAVTAASGMDALTQAVEAYLTKRPNPVSDTMALQACELIHHHLPTAVAEGNDLDAREGMLLGSLFSAFAFSNSGLGAAHGLSHPLGARLGVPHGLACAVLLPHVMRLNLEVRRERLGAVAACFGRGQPQEAIEEVKRLLAAIHLAPHLRDYGLNESQFPALIAESRGSSMSKNPYAPTDEELHGVLAKLL